MLLALLALVAGSAAGWAAGRRLPRSAGGWRGVVLVPVGAVLLIAGARWVGGGLGVALSVAGYGALLAFAAANRRHPGLMLVATGILANLVVIAADGGMPVRGLAPGATAAGGHHGLSSRDHLTGLSDMLRLPGLHETVSPGDLLIALGGAVAVFFWLEPTQTPGRARAGGAKRADRAART